MQSWMFLSSFEKMREQLLKDSAIECMAHMANMVMGIAFGTSATVWKKNPIGSIRGAYCFIEYEDLDGNKPKRFPPQNERNERAFKENNMDGFYRVSADDFQKIPGSPIAYWASETVYSLFTREKVVDYGYLCNGMTTGDNNQFLRIWFEVAFNRNNTQAGSLEDAYISKKKWFPYNKGGDFRRWYGNNDFVINWENNGSQIKEYGHLVPRSMKYMFLPSLTWSKISSGIISFRYKPSGHLFDVAGLSIFIDERAMRIQILGFLNSKVASTFSKLMSQFQNNKSANKYASIRWRTIKFAI